MHMFSSPGARAAFRFADIAHAGQLRRYVTRPYIEHPVAVARLVQRFDHDEAMVMAALLHDVQEDCGVQNQVLVAEFGDDVASLVDDLSDVSTSADGNREARKAVDRAHTARAQPRAKTIKSLDFVVNALSIVRYDRQFASVFLHEKGLLLPLLADASDQRALQLAYRVHARALAAMVA